MICGDIIQSEISITRLHKSYPKNNGQKTEVLKHFSLDVSRGEVVCIFGPNSCGKSTLLHILAGLEPFDSGSVLIGGKRPYDAKAGFVFQDYNASLFPWRSALGNVMYALECNGVQRKSAFNKAAAMLARVGLSGYANKYPYELSGGMRQRISIARALAFEPDVLLLDEPFSALDYDTRLRMEEELLQLLSQNRVTTICVSHDVDEAVFLADRVIVLSPQPASIHGVVEIDLPKPRNSETRSSQRFLELRNRVVGLYRHQTLRKESIP